MTKAQLENILGEINSFKEDQPPDKRFNIMIRVNFGPMVKWVALENTMLIVDNIPTGERSWIDLDSIRSITC